MRNLFALFVVVLLRWTAPALAAPVTSEFPGTASPIVVPVLSNDLLQTNLSSATLTAGSIDPEGTTNIAVLYDGAMQTDIPFLLTPNAGAQLTFVLDTSLGSNALGYNITSIKSYGGWNDSGRDRQHFSIEYSQVATPLAFSPVDAVDFDPLNLDGGDSASLADFSVSLTNVKALRINFLTQENGHAGYGELDVIGTAIPAPAPEPGTWALLGLGALGLAWMRHRRI